MMLETMLYELNPKNDTEVLRTANQPLDPFTDDINRNFNIFCARMITLVKPLLRGGSIGAAAGASISLALDYDVLAGMYCGAKALAIADSLQYYPRIIYQQVKEQHRKK